MADLSKIYDTRFNNTGLLKRDRVWKAICTTYFQKLIPETSSVLDMACGYGEFINNIKAKEKYGADLNPDAPNYLNSDVVFYHTPATDLLDLIARGSLDIVFTSNFLEHLRSKEECSLVLEQVLAVLKPGGRFIIMGPNIRYCFAEYWDYYDHYLPLSHLSLAEGLGIAGFEVTEIIPQFLPYTMNNSTPAHPLLVKAYLAFPPLWKVMGKQFLVTARKPTK